MDINPKIGASMVFHTKIRAWCMISQIQKQQKSRGADTDVKAVVTRCAQGQPLKWSQFGHDMLFWKPSVSKFPHPTSLPSLEHVHPMIKGIFPITELPSPLGVECKKDDTLISDTVIN